MKLASAYVFICFHEIFCSLIMDEKSVRTYTRTYTYTYTDKPDMHIIQFIRRIQITIVIRVSPYYRSFSSNPSMKNVWKLYVTCISIAWRRTQSDIAVKNDLFEIDVITFYA